MSKHDRGYRCYTVADLLEVLATLELSTKVYLDNGETDTAPAVIRVLGPDTISIEPGADL